MASEKLNPDFTIESLDVWQNTINMRNEISKILNCYEFKGIRKL